MSSRCTSVKVVQFDAYGDYQTTIPSVLTISFLKAHVISYAAHIKVDIQHPGILVLCSEILCTILDGMLVISKLIYSGLVKTAKSLFIIVEWGLWSFTR